MDNMFCTGREFRLDRCRFDGWGVHDCNHAEAAGVVCDGQRARAISQATPAEQSPNAAPAEKTAIRVSIKALVSISFTGNLPFFLLGSKESLCQSSMGGVRTSLNISE